MLVRAASVTPEESAVVNTSPVSRKRKHAEGTDDVDSVEPTAAPDIVLANDTSRPRLTISRHPVFLPSTDASAFLMTELCAVNRTLDKVGFKYVPAGLAEPGAAIPYRTIESKPMCTRVSWEDRSPFIRVTQDGLGLAGAKGFRSARTNVGVQEGKWYMEVKIDKGGGDGSNQLRRVEGAHVRLGWGRREAPLNGPIGLDGYSYGIRDKTGDKVTLSRPRPYGSRFGTGDVVGLYISLPPRCKANPKDPDDPAHVRRERIAIDFKGQEYFESLDYPQSKEMISLMDTPSKTAKAEPPQTKKSATVKNLPTERGRNKHAPPKIVPQRPLPILPGSKIAFFINGECQGVAFQDVYDYLQLRPPSGTRRNREKQRRNKDGPREHTENHFDDGTLGYYPFFSLFGDAHIRLNPGPDFEFPPPPDIDALLSGQSSPNNPRTWRPMSERYAEFMSQQWDLDAKEEAEAKGEAETTVVDSEQEEKLKLKRERKRQSEAARRRRLKEEKIAAAAAAAVTVAAGGFQHRLDMPLMSYTASAPSPTAVNGSSPSPSHAPSLAPSTAAEIEIEETLFTSYVPTSSTSSPSKEHNESAPVEIMQDISRPQTPQSSDFGGGTQEHWDEEDEEMVAQDLDMDQEAYMESQLDPPEGGTSMQPHLGFEESSARSTRK